MANKRCPYSSLEAYSDYIKFSYSDLVETFQVRDNDGKIVDKKVNYLAEVNSAYQKSKNMLEARLKLALEQQGGV